MQFLWVFSFLSRAKQRWWVLLDYKQQGGKTAPEWECNIWKSFSKTSFSTGTMPHSSSVSEGRVVRQVKPVTPEIVSPRVACQGWPQNSLLSKEGLGLGRGRCKKSKKGKLGSQDCWISATDRQPCWKLLQTPVPGVSATPRETAHSFLWSLAKSCQGLGRASSGGWQWVRQSTPHPSCLHSAHRPSAHLLPTSQPASQASSGSPSLALFIQWWWNCTALAVLRQATIFCIGLFRTQ